MLMFPLSLDELYELPLDFTTENDSGQLNANRLQNIVMVLWLLRALLLHALLKKEMSHVCEKEV